MNSGVFLDMGVVLATFKATGTLPIGTKLPVRKRDDATFQPGEVLAMKAKPDNSHSTAEQRPQP